MTNRTFATTALAAALVAGTGAVAVSVRSRHHPAAPPGRTGAPATPARTGATAPVPSPAAPPRPGTFVAERGGRVGVFSARTGRDLRWLTPPRAETYPMAPRLGADGRTVVYAVAGALCGGEVRTVGISGGAARTLVRASLSPGSPVLDAAGRRLAYAESTCGKETRTTIVVRDVRDGTERRWHGRGLRPLAWRGTTLLLSYLTGADREQLALVETAGARLRDLVTLRDPGGCDLEAGTFEPVSGQVLYARRCLDDHLPAVLVLVAASGTGPRRTVYYLDETRGAFATRSVDYDASGTHLLVEQFTDPGQSSTAVVGPEGYERLRTGVGSASWQ